MRTVPVSARTGPSPASLARSVRPDAPATDPVPAPDTSDDTSYVPGPTTVPVDEHEVAIMDALVAVAMSIPGVVKSAWFVGSETSEGPGELSLIPPYTPFIVFMKKTGWTKPKERTNTSEMVELQVVMSMFMYADVQMTNEAGRLMSESCMRLVSQLTDKIDGNSFGGLVCPHLTYFNRGRPVNKQKAGVGPMGGNINFEITLYYLRYYKNVS